MPTHQTNTYKGSPAEQFILDLLEGIKQIQQDFPLPEKNCDLSHKTAANFIQVVAGAINVAVSKISYIDEHRIISKLDAAKLAVSFAPSLQNLRTLPHLEEQKKPPAMHLMLIAFYALISRLVKNIPQDYKVFAPFLNRHAFDIFDENQNFITSLGYMQGFGDHLAPFEVAYALAAGNVPDNASLDLSSKGLNMNSVKVLLQVLQVVKCPIGLSINLDGNNIPQYRVNKIQKLVETSNYNHEAVGFVQAFKPRSHKNQSAFERLSQVKPLAQVIGSYLFGTQRQLIPGQLQKADFVLSKWKTIQHNAAQGLLHFGLHKEPRITAMDEMKGQSLLANESKNEPAKPKRRMCAIS